MQAELRFNYNGMVYSVSHNNPWSSYQPIPTEEHKRLIERELIKQVAKLIVEKSHITWE